MSILDSNAAENDFFAARQRQFNVKLAEVKREVAAAIALVDDIESRFTGLTIPANCTACGYSGEMRAVSLGAREADLVCPVCDLGTVIEIEDV